MSKDELCGAFNDWLAEGDLEEHDLHSRDLENAWESFLEDLDIDI